MTNVSRISTVVETIKAAREQSELCWEMAKDTADNETAAAEWEAEGEACDDHYYDALNDIENGDYDGALRSLVAARSLEAKGGDDQHGRRAIEALRSVLSDSTAT